MFHTQWTIGASLDVLLPNVDGQWISTQWIDMTSEGHGDQKLRPSEFLPVKLLRSWEVVAKGEENLEWVVRKGDDENWLCS